MPHPITYTTHNGEPLPNLWDYSLDTYAKNGVSRACLALQDYFDLDVNMVLYTLWAGKQGYELTAEDIATIADVPHHWQVNTVIPIRTARQQIKQQIQTLPTNTAGEMQTLYAELKKQELTAEQMEQDLIQTCHNKHNADKKMPAPTATDCGHQNLTQYATQFATPMVANDDTPQMLPHTGEPTALNTIINSLHTLSQ